MLEISAVRPSLSLWASPTILVRKKDGKMRFCMDLYKVNERTVGDA